MAGSKRRPRFAFPHHPGTYVLVCYLGEARELRIGRLGNFALEAGSYIYVGSALGPGGLAARLERHLAPDQRTRRWHIDYLTEASLVKQVWYSQSEHRYEHEWATFLSEHAYFRIPVSRFGASDCRCPSHLFYFNGRHLPTMGEACIGQITCQSLTCIIVDLD